MIVDLASEADFQLGALQVRPSIRQVEAGGASETLEPRIMQVLVVLARRRNEVVSRDALIEACWEGRIVGEDALNRCTSRIRKLGETHAAFRLETIPRVGYRMHVKEAHASPPLRSPSGEPEPAARATGSGRLGPHPLRLIAAVVAGGVLFAGWLGWWLNLNSRAVDVSVPRLTLAILSFDAPPGDAELERFARAVSQTTADELIRDGLTVVAPSRAMELPADRKAEAAQLFDVHALIDGNVSREGELVRVGLRLDHAKEGITVWSSTIDGELESPAAVASRVTAQLRQKLALPGMSSLLLSDQPHSAERTRAWFRIIQLSDEGDDRGAMNAAKDFVRLWPNHSSPLFMLAIETMDALHELSDSERILAYQEARDAARESLRLRTADSREGPENAVASVTPPYAWGDRISAYESILVDERHISWNADYFHTGHTNVAHERIGDGPFNAKTALILRAEVYLARGETRLAERELRNGTYIYPLHWRFPELRFESAAWLGAPDEAEALLDKPGAWRVTEVQRDILSRYLAARRTPNSRNTLAVADQCVLRTTITDDTALIYCLSALTILGRIDDAFATAEVLLPDLRPQAGDDPAAPRWLSAPAAAWEPIVLYMPWTATLRSDQRIIPVFERLGLLDYWRDSGNWPDFCEIEIAARRVCSEMKADN